MTDKAEQDNSQVRVKAVLSFEGLLSVSVVRILRIAVGHSSLPVNIRVEVPGTDVWKHGLLLQLILRNTALEGTR